MIQEYRPEFVEPPGTSLPEELGKHVEDMAASVHDVWAAQRIRMGWTYGPYRDDSKKQTPFLVPYDNLPEEEKVYDRNTALQTVQFILSRGYEIRYPSNEKVSEHAAEALSGRVSKTIIRFHRPEEENGYLSNWYLCDFVLDGKRYCCSEQYMMEQKALLFGDAEIAGKILSVKDQRAMQALGRAVHDFDSRTWDGFKQMIAYRAVLAKFYQNPELTEKLLATGDATLAECSKSDRIWGIGLSMWDAAADDPAQWNGQNLLGFTLMAVRDALRRNARIQ